MPRRHRRHPRDAPIFASWVWGLPIVNRRVSCHVADWRRCMGSPHPPPTCRRPVSSSQVPSAQSASSSQPAPAAFAPGGVRVRHTDAGVVAGVARVTLGVVHAVTADRDAGGGAVGHAGALVTGLTGAALRVAFRYRRHRLHRWWCWSSRWLRRSETGPEQRQPADSRTAESFMVSPRVRRIEYSLPPKWGRRANVTAPERPGASTFLSRSPFRAACSARPRRVDCRRGRALHRGRHARSSHAARRSRLGRAPLFRAPTGRGVGSGRSRHERGR